MPIFLGRLYLNDLVVVELEDCESVADTPLVPLGGHSHFGRDNSSAEGFGEGIVVGVHIELKLGVQLV